MSQVTRIPEGAAPISFAECVDGLLRVGLRSGDSVLVHASLRALGFVDGGPRTLGLALLHVVGDQGLVVMPSFNHGAPFAPGGAGHYDPKTTPSASGALSEWFRKESGVHRSLHPTHPFAARGPGAAELVAEEPDAVTMGSRSPIAKLAARGGLMLHLGTDHAVSTAKHFAEVHAGARCLGELGDEFPVLLPSGTLTSRRSFRYRAAPCPVTDDAELVGDALAREGVERLELLRGARLRLVRLQDFLRVVVGLLEAGAPESPPCSRCPIRPSHRREGDWA